MVRVTVEYLTLLRELTGKTSEVVAIPEASLGSLLLALDRQYGPRWQSLLWIRPGEAISPYMMVIVNGILERDLAAPLADGSIVAITPAVSGG